MLPRLKRSRWQRWLVMPVLCLGLASQAQAPLRLPSLGDGAEWALGEERQLGDAIMAQVWRDPDIIDDPVLLDYVQGLWSPLLSAARQRGELSAELDQRFAWDMVLVRDRSVNAFALPGGYMGVHLGLIAVASNRDELAAVLAHETSHVTQRHIARMFAQESKTTPLVLGAMLLGLLAASRSPDAAGALMVGGQAAALQTQLSFSRDMEREADRVGFGLLAPAGFHSQGAITLFDKLIQAARLNDSGAYPYLRSHPMSTERMADMTGRAQQLGLADKTQPADVMHALMSARAGALTDTSADGQRLLILQAQERPASPMPTLLSTMAAWYAGVVAHMQAQQYLQAEQLLGRLRLALPGSGMAQDRLAWLAAELNLRQGQPARALSELANVSAASAGQRAHFVLRWQALLASRQLPDVRLANGEIDLWLSRRGRDGQVWEMSAQGLELVGDPLRSLRAQAESRAVRFDFVAAIDRLLAAQDLVRALSRQGPLTRAQEIDASIIDTRLRQLRQARREQALQR
ncbi:MAG: M48 family metalloprotease [Alphaproteobacteria bacterium]|nr:M48 family metalloprotease [Alphaproteobacteria bacterium]